MPLEFKKVNGKWVGVGGTTAEEEEPAAAPAPRPRPQPRQQRRQPARQKPWWEVAGGVVGGALMRSFTPAPTVQGLTGVVGAAADVGRFADAMIQRHVERRPRAGTSGRSQALDAVVDGAHRLLGVTPPSEMTRKQYEEYQLQKGVTTGVLTTFVPGLRAAAGARTAGGAALRGGAAFAAGEALNTYLTDNRGGNPIDLINALTGRSLPGGVSQNADWLDAANQSLVPNALTALGLGALTGGAHAGLRATARRIRNGRTVAGQERARARLEAMGTTRPNAETGAATFTPGARAPQRDSWADAQARVREWIGGAKGKDEARRAAANPMQAFADPWQGPARGPRIRPQDAQQPERPTPLLPGAPQAAPLPAAPERPALPGAEDPQRPALPAAPEPEALPGAGPNQPALPPGQRQVIAVPEESALQDYLRMRYGVTTFEPNLVDPMDASPVQRALGQMEEQQPSASRQAEEPKPAAEEPAAAEAQADPDVELEEEIDPTLPEADTLVRAVEGLSDEELIAVLEGGQAEVVPTIERITAARPQDAPAAANPRLRADLVMAPEASLSADVTGNYRNTLRGMGEGQLRQLVDPELNPELSAFVQNTTGKEVDDLELGDLLDGLEAWRAQRGQVAIPRDYEQVQTTPVAEIGVDPERFQFKQGVDASGRQQGNVLEKVDRWNPALEQVVTLWRDPQTGQQWVANGHHSVAKAKELGIPSIPTRTLLADTAEQARALAAAANIATDSGTVWDAAKFFREQGVMSPEALRALGINIDVGNGEMGAALARLPLGVFRDAQDGLISLPKALAMGRANLTEATVNTLAAMAKADPKMTDGTFRQLVQMGEGVEDSAPAATGRTNQPVLEGMEQLFSNLKPKAELLARIERDLGSDRTLMNRTARNAERLGQVGNQIDTGATGAAGTEADQALRFFEGQKLQAGPLADLLNQGAAEIAAGAKVGEVADRLTPQIKQLSQQSPEELAAPAVNPDQGGLFDEAAAAAPAEAPALTDPQLPARRQQDMAAEAAQPTPLVDVVMPPEVRQSAEEALIRQAIQQGEVRPPETPIPQLPEPPAIDLDVAARELAEAMDVEPGSPQAQALADELRLIAEDVADDAALQWEAVKDARDASGYELLTFDQKKNGPMVEGYDPPPAGDYPPVPFGPVKGLTEPQTRLVAELVDAQTAEELSTGLMDLDRAPMLIDQLTRKLDGATAGRRRQIESLIRKLQAKYDYIVAEPVANKRWEPGMKLKTGDRLETATGRTTSGFPALPRGTARADMEAGVRRSQWVFENAAAEATARGDAELAAKFRDFAEADAPGRARETLPLKWDLEEAEQYLFGQARPQEATPPTKPERVRLVDDEPANPQVGAKLTDKEELLLVKLKVAEDARMAHRQLREGTMPADEARRLAEEIRRLDKEGGLAELGITGYQARTARSIAKKLEAAAGEPAAVKERIGEIEATLAANEEQADAIRRKAIEEGC